MGEGTCVGDGLVTLDELITGGNIALGNATPNNECAVFDSSHDVAVTIDEIIAAANAALNGCGA